MSPTRPPSVERLARSLPPELPRRLAVDVARAAVAESRTRAAAGEAADPELLAAAAARRLTRRRLHPVVNATGVLLHTNLGRAPLHPAAADAARTAAVGYGNLELDLDDGARGGRGAYLATLLTALTGAEDALAVNNNAGGLLLALLALARDGEVPVSRGELVEIGGSYRLPDLMAATGARLVEVGTTNRTRLGDYRAAVGPDTRLLLKVHASNFRIVGFTAEATLPELAALAAEHRLPLVFDTGSGLLDDRVPWLPGPPPAWLAGEPGIVQALGAGADLVLFSGDKLFGGPQAGIVIGRRALVGALRAHPAARALRLDGPTLAALEATAGLYADGRAAELPFWRMASASYEELVRRAEALVAAAGVEADVRPGAATPGAGSVPGATVPSPVIVVPGRGDAYLALLAGDPPVLARREAGSLVLDLRAVDPDLDPVLAAALSRSLAS